jgi:uncharacterized protein YjiS (DUF1127 family)
MMQNSLINRFGRSIARYRRVRNGMRQLERLNDRELKDIGITRSQIYSSAMHGLER